MQTSTGTNEMQFEIRNWLTGDVQVTAEIECADDTLASIKLGLAVRWAVHNKADLRGANLSGADLSGVDLRGANLSGADLSGVDLRGANLSGADLYGANLYGADLSGADLSGAYLRGADLSEADLSEAYLRGAYLRGADLSGADLSEADLRGADLSGADLSEAKSIVSFGPVGKKRRIGYAVAHHGGPRIQLGCFWGTLDEACAAIEKKYGENSTYEQLVRAACAALEPINGEQ
jgi:hypothetical protein